MADDKKRVVAASADTRKPRARKRAAAAASEATQSAPAKIVVKKATAKKTTTTKKGTTTKKEGAKKAAVKKVAKAKPKPEMRILPLGGLDGIGKNMDVFECDGDIIVVDAGLMFPDDDNLGVDLILPDYSYLVERADHIRGLIVTHGHEDHTGAIPYLLKDLGVKIPIYGTRMTLGLIQGKLNEHHIGDISMNEIAGGQQINLGCFTVDFFDVNHSIPGALGAFIQSPAGTVLHTGDFKLDQTPIDGVHTDFAAISRFGVEGVDLMMSDSTNAERGEFTKSEAEVGRTLDRIIRDATQRVVVACFSSHIHRVQQVCDAAAAAGRKVAVTGRSMLTNTRIARELGYLEVPDDLIVDSYDIMDTPPEDIVVLCTGSQGEPLSALARMANGEHRTVQIEEGDTIIISATPVPGNEKAVTRVVNSLSKIGADVYDKNRALVHVSGHASSEELKIMLSMVKPRFFLPVHGETKHLRAHARLAAAVGVERGNIFLLENGDSLVMKDHEVTRGETFEAGIIYVDGLSVGDTDKVVLRDRQVLASDGIATVAIMLDTKKKRVVGDMELVMRGIAVGDDEELMQEAHEAVLDAIENIRGHAVETSIVQRAVREALSKLLWARCHRRPMVIPVIMEV